MCGPSWLVSISDLAQGLVPRIPIPWRTQSKGFPPFSLWKVQRHVVVSRGLSRVYIHASQFPECGWQLKSFLVQLVLMMTQRHLNIVLILRR